VKTPRPTSKGGKLSPDHIDREKFKGRTVREAETRSRRNVMDGWLEDRGSEIREKRLSVDEAVRLGNNIR